MKSAIEVLPNEPFDKFEALAKHVFNVPKDALKVEEAKYKAERQKLEKRPGRKRKSS